MSFSPSDKLARITAVSLYPPHDEDRRSLLHAYVACLEFDELCTMIAGTLDGPVKLRRALRNRLVRVLRQNRTDLEVRRVAVLAEEMTGASLPKSLRQAADAHNSALFTYLPPPAQQIVLDQWVDRGTSGTMGRWFRATKDVPTLFDVDVALAYWRTGYDTRSAKYIAYQTPQERLVEIVPEIIAHCKEGWILAKAVVRAETMDHRHWKDISEGFPSTYLYLLAETGGTISGDDAFELVCRCGIQDRGLAIWAVGQMGMIEVLDRIHGAIDSLKARDMLDFSSRST